MWFELIERGGWVMLPLALCSLLALTVIVERCIWGPRRSRVIPDELLAQVRDLISRGRIDELMGLCRAQESPLARIVLVAARNVRRSRQEVVTAVEAVGKKEAFELQKYLPILGTIAAIAPLLGLLGTVSGMIRTFAVIKDHGVGNAPALAGGISEALLTTAVGLAIAIPTLVFHHYFRQKTRRLIVETETIVVDLLDQLGLAIEAEGSTETKQATTPLGGDSGRRTA